MVAMNGVQDLERSKLLEASKFSSIESQAINNLKYLGVNLSHGGAKKEQGRYSYWGSYKVERKKRQKGKEDLPYDLSRYVPLMKRLLEVIIFNPRTRLVIVYQKMRFRGYKSRKVTSRH
jgi:syntaxin-binding protein 1